MQRFARRIGYARRMAGFVLLHGRLGGFVGLGRGIVYSPEMRVELAADAWIGAYTVFQGAGRVSIGKRAYVGAFASFNCVERISIGEDSMLANSVSLIDNSHGMDPSQPYGKQPLHSAAITIGSGCWISEKVTVLEGVTIGNGAIVAAGAVVRESVAARTLVAGVPARVIRAL